MEITCYRDSPCASEHCTLPAETYNLATILLARNSVGQLFVPIRSMQYLAILDSEEFVFIDGERKCWVDIAWHHFKPQARQLLTDPVPFEAAYYRPTSIDWVRRLYSEFPLALRQLAAREKPAAPAGVLKFPSPDSSNRS
jgi:hypothetical protein